MKKIIIAGFPCTKFSVAQKNKRVTDLGFTAREFMEFRENNDKWWSKTELFEKEVGKKNNNPEYKFDIGVHLFLNCLATLDQTDYDYYMFENVSSMKKEVKETINDIMTLLYGGFMIEINSALVSAQNRKRLYWTNFSVEQPEDKMILLKDVLDDYNEESLCVACRGRYQKELGKNEQRYEVRGIKTNTLTTVQKDNAIASPIKVGVYPTDKLELKDSQGQRIYSVDAKSVTLTSAGGGKGHQTGLYAQPVKLKNTYSDKDDVTLHLVVCYDVPHGFNKGGIAMRDKIGTLTAKGSYQTNHFVFDVPDGIHDVYEVKDGKISVKNMIYDIKLNDGFYIIRRLTVSECCRLQTMPDDYFMNEEGEKIISDSRAYTCLGNGWTSDVIEHIWQFANIDEDIEVISLYDGISTGYHVFEKMGLNISKYEAYEIDKYAIAVSEFHFPNIIRHGDAMSVREN